MTRQDQISRNREYQKARRAVKSSPNRPSPRWNWAAAVFSIVFLLAGYHVLAADKSPEDQRKDAAKAMKAGNFKDALIGLTKLIEDPNADPVAVGKDLGSSVNCLNRLGRVEEADALIEKAVGIHAKNWRLLEAAANQYGQIEHDGRIIAGVFHRGPSRGDDGKWVNAFSRDRVRALQLMEKAMEAAIADPKKEDAGAFFLRMADEVMGARFSLGSWRLQYLTDLTQLPDYDESYPEDRFGQRRGAPVDEAGKPVFHAIPKDWKAAKTDGERWRWCLVQGAEYAPKLADKAKYTFALFLREQFDVQTMLDYGLRGMGRGRFYPQPVDPPPGAPGAKQEDDTRKDESGPYAVSSLGEDETIAKLANGIKRFKLPDEFNFIKLLKELSDDPKLTYAQHGAQLLAQLFEDRQQLEKAATYWKLCVDRNWSKDFCQTRLDQIVGNWGEFDPTASSAAGVEANLGFLFRNGSKVSFTAQSLDYGKLLEDVKAYIKTKPERLDWEKMNLSDIGYRIVQRNQNQYIIKEVANWQLDLKPRAKHLDKRTYVKVPVKEAGAYLVTAKMEGGNTTRIVVWLSDTAIVKKAIDGGTYLFVGDANSGSPIAKANVSFFGYNQQWQGDGKKYLINTKEFAEFADADGQVIVKSDQASNDFNWLITATSGDRKAFLGFTNIWFGGGFDQEYQATKAFFVTDRPVYRPAQTMKFKAWIGQAKYDQEGKSVYADKNIVVRITDPRGEKLSEKACQTDAFGGLEGELTLGKEATLGIYNLEIINFPAINEYGGNTFRVEEYKKPEFEVKVDAPTEPVMLGDKIAATIKANYYFGAPVANAKVKYKVMRTSYRAEWYPAGRWDWFYEPGYWWFGHDYRWYPGFFEWGCLRPVPQWFGRQAEQPELVAENEVPVGADGTVKVEIDTSIAKAVHADSDHKYEITAEVTDESRRTIVGTGSVSVARKPFKVYAWLDRGYFNVGDDIRGYFSAQTLDNKPVKGKGELKLLKLTYDPKAAPKEEAVQTWPLDTNEEGKATQQFKAAAPGQYRLSYKVSDAQGRQIEGGYVFVVRGQGFDGKDYRFNDLELTADKQEYAPGEAVKLMVNTNRASSTVLLFERASNGLCKKPRVLRLDGKSTVQELTVEKKDMPNFFVEAVTLSNGKVHDETKELVVPPESRVTNVSVKTSQDRYRPGEKGTVTFTLTDNQGKPVQGTAVVSLYDKSVEYISGGSNTPDIRKFFWQWRRHHYPRTESSLMLGSGPIHKSGERTLQMIGRFGQMSAEMLQEGEKAEELFFFDRAAGLSDLQAAGEARPMTGGGFGRGGGGGRDYLRKAASKNRGLEMDAAPMAHAAAEPTADKAEAAQATGDPGGGASPAIRTKFADTALWAAAVTTDANGQASVSLDMPENLTTWKAKVWSVSQGTRVGQGDAEVTTYKDLIIRLQAPRFFVQKDEVVLSANVHNYTKQTKQVQVKLDLPGDVLGLVSEKAGEKPSPVKFITLASGAEQRVDWRVQVIKPGEAKVRMSAIADGESDATEQSFPAYIHGMLKTDSFSGALRSAEKSASLTFNIPNERLPEQTRVEIRYSPSVASAMVDALPYLVDFPYGCTEQTLNRFLPTVVTQKVLLNMGLDLKDIQQKRTNLNAQEIGDDAKRAADWKRNNPPNPGVKERNPVFDQDTVVAMTKDGVNRLTNMQNADGGWGWFSGFGEQSYPHTTALVVHGLQIAKENDVAIVPGVLERGVEWLKKYQAEQVNLLNRAPAKKPPYKEKADDLDAFVYMVLTDAGQRRDDMREFIYRDRVDLSVQCKTMFGLALHKQLPKQQEKLDMILRNIEQFLVKDAENQTAYLKLPENNRWWYWHGSDTESNAYYLKLLTKTDPKGETPALLAKYLINNRKHASYWNSTRDTATVIEALADFIKASGEDKPDLTVQVLVDGKQQKEVKISAANLFSYDNKLVLEGPAVTSGQHKVEIVKTGNGPLYFNAYVTNFTLEDSIKKAGLEIKVDRKFYKLVRKEKTIKAEGQRGQALDQKVEAYDRQLLADLSQVQSGDLVEVELEIDSKNDYEYLIFEDMKASGFEPMEVQSGYNGNDLNAYVEFRDERVAFFARTLARGRHSVSYRLRAEIPGKFSALPTKASAMYAPELKANSDEFKVSVTEGK